MNFEYDPDKSASNKDKHKIDFEEAQRLWDDLDRIEFDAHSDDEPRFLTIGRIGTKLWSAIFTLRDGKVRLISVRRARDEERQWYEENRGN